MRNPIGVAAHMVARFFTSLGQHPPSDEGRAWVRSVLSPQEWALWERSDNPDKRHSIAVARRFASVRPEATNAELAGAILHDIGKLECDLGTFGRVAATIVGPRGERFRAYHDHEEIGAEMVAAIGGDPATVQLIRGEGPAYPDLQFCDHA
jgi:putative nucleotidyltransferase with HDIG domain